MIKGVSKRIKNEAKEEKGGFLNMLLGTLCASLLGNLLRGKAVMRAGEEKIRVGQDLECWLILSEFEIQKNYQNESKLDGVYSRNNLPKIKNGVYIINTDEYESIKTHWTAWYAHGNIIMHFDSFGVNIFQKRFENS